MPLPRWLAQVNKRTFNRWELKRGKRPVLIHQGRRSGNTHETPLDAHEVEGGFIFIANYGTRSDWVRNILASGRATLRLPDRAVELTRPRIISGKEAWKQMPPDAEPLPGYLNIDDYLRMDLAP